MSKGWRVADMPRQDGRRVIITGGNSGIGYYAAVELARHGAALVIACRNRAKGEDAALRLGKEVSGATVEVAPLNLASLASVRAFAEAELARPEPLDVLINNAGVYAPPKRLETEDGFELQFGTNVLGHFALTGRLLPKLERRAAQVANSGDLVAGAHELPRVVYIASIAHKVGRLHFDDLQWTGRYTPNAAYQQSKLADLMLSFELDRRLRAAGSKVVSVAAHPGVSNTNLFQGEQYIGFEQAARRTFGRFIEITLNSAAAGAVPTLFAASAPEAVGGGYYGPPSFFEMRGDTAVPAKVAARARSEADAARLWTACEALTGVHYL